MDANANEEDEELEYFNSIGFFKGIAKRADIHNKGLWHKGVHVWLFNTSGKLFLKKRARYKSLHPLHWEDVGEHLKPNESFEQAAIRGLREELGIDEKNIIRLYKVRETRMEFGNDRELIELWFCIYDGPIEESKESFDGQFFSLDDIKTMMKNREPFTPWFKELFYWCIKEGKWPEQKDLESKS